MIHLIYWLIALAIIVVAYKVIPMIVDWLEEPTDPYDDVNKRQNE